MWDECEYKNKQELCVLAQGKDTTFQSSEDYLKQPDGLQWLSGTGKLTENHDQGQVT